jgi:hypothetical protein
MNMKTLCVGRFLIDIPVTAVVSYRSASLTGWNISSWAETEDKFLARNIEQVSRLTSERNERGGLSLEQIREISNEYIRGRIFVFNRMWQETIQGGVKQTEEVISIRAFVRAQDVTYRFYAKIRWDSDIQKLEKIITQLRWRGENEIPIQAGFCFDRALVREPFDVDFAESTAVFVGLKEHPDVAIALSTMAGISPDRSLLQREADNDIKKEFRWRFHAFHEGSRIINSIPGEEVLDRVHEPNGSVLHGFMWESLSKEDDVYRPLLTLEFSTGRGNPGKPVKATSNNVI